jgi:hypothetical protein
VDSAVNSIHRREQAMSSNDAHTDKALPPKKSGQTCDKSSQDPDDLPSSSPCLLSSDAQDIDPDYLPDYSRKHVPKSPQGTK